MAQLIQSPAVIPAAGSKSKLIEEFVGRVNTATAETSIAHMKSPSGWKEPGQTPDFTEYTLVLRGEVQVETASEIICVKAGQAIITFPGEWVRFSSPGPEGAEYIAICVPAFSPDAVHRDPD